MSLNLFVRKNVLSKFPQKQQIIQPKTDNFRTAPLENFTGMEIDYIILDSNSSDEMELLMDEKALDGYKAVSLNSCYDPNRGVVYTALMVNYGINGQLEDVLVQISEKLDAISTSLMLIESNDSDNVD